MSVGYFPKREKVGLEDLFRGLVNASHILHHHGILDAFGHISVRSPDDKDTFLMACDMHPALLTCPDDLVEYHVESAEPVDEKKSRPGFAERYIHSEIYKRFPGINSVVHSRASHVLPYCVCEVPLKATLSSAGFLGTSVPCWNALTSRPSGSEPDFLVSNSTLGASLAAAFKPSTSAAFIYAKIRSALPSQLGGGAASSEQSVEPDHAVVLQQNHGFTTIAHGVEEAVYQAIYTQEAARAQTRALTIQNAFTDYTLRGKVDVESGGRIEHGRATASDKLHYLGTSEAQASWKMSSQSAMKSWALWCREVDLNSLYKNDCPSGED